jgi:hypothetical protein
MVSVTGFTTAGLRLVSSVLRLLCAVRLDAAFASVCLRDALALFEAVFVEREVVFAAAGPVALAPRRDLDATALAAGWALRDAAALEALFFDAPVFFVAVRPRALAPVLDFDAALFFGDLAITQLLDAAPICGPGADESKPCMSAGGTPVKAAS